ncbi:MAG: diphthamide biosynthesis enzyme Dph2 [Candidatus Bathyarchaeota archaeon]|jgi:2-(3-amino-3-carboxypropyl)histidine synthase
MLSFDFEEERVKREITEHKAKTVLIQLPEGLKQHGPYIAKTIGKTGVLPIISADPCYGACDLATSEAEGLNVDLIIHYGHTKLAKYERVPTIYVEARGTVTVEETIRKTFPLMTKWQRIGLVTTIQHVQMLDTVKEILLDEDKIVAVGDAGYTRYPGQVIGCDYSNAKSIAADVEAFLFIGGGRFHALGVALSTSKPTLVADPYEQRAFSVDKDARKTLRKRWANISETRNAQIIAILIGLKPGQKRLDEAMILKQKFEKKGKKIYLFAIRNIAPDVFLNFPTVEAYINTACPRLSLDDSEQFSKPLLTTNEALVAINELSWEELCRKGLFER